MSMTSLPSMSSVPIGTPPPVVTPPVLASDILREDVAPIAPLRGAVRGWLAACALGFGIVAVASQQGLTRSSEGAFTGAVVVAGLALLAALVPAPYAARAMAATIAGLVPLVVGTQGRGPLAALSAEGVTPATLGLVLIATVPGVLLFRARYRAFKAARVILAAALVAALPALALVATQVIAAQAPLLDRIGGVALIAASLLSVAGFMGAETSGGCTLWAGLILLTHASRLAMRGFEASGGAERYTLWATALGELMATTLVAVGVFQLLAVALARAARRVDVRKAVGPSAEGGP